MGGIEFASGNMTPLRLLGGFPPDPKFQCWEKIALADETEAACNGIEFASATQNHNSEIWGEG